MDDTAKQLSQKEPEIASQIASKVSSLKNLSEAQPGLLGNEPCPACKGTMKFAEYAPGPLGRFNAWFRCESCNHRYQTRECFGD